jgi:hypothetical protein
MRTWALVSQKGGSGKSTFATQVARFQELGVFETRGLVVTESPALSTAISIL